MSGDRVCVGAIVGAYGTNGEIRLKSFCADPLAITGYGHLWCGNTALRRAMTITRPIRGGFAARLTGVESREQAEDLRGTLLYADRSALPDLENDEFYQSDLIGLEVFNMEGTNLGRVHAVLDFGAGDILEVRKTNSNDSILLPFTAAPVPTVDMTAGRIVVDPPDGSMPDPEGSK